MIRLTYHLLTNHERISDFRKHDRELYPQASDLTLHNLSQDNCLFAIVEEGLRIFAPVANTLPGISPLGGATISAYLLPVAQALASTNGRHTTRKQTSGIWMNSIRRGGRQVKTRKSHPTTGELCNPSSMARGTVLEGTWHRRNRDLVG
jgi:hypothetical protein